MSDVLPVAEAKKQLPMLIREATEHLKIYQVANAQRKHAQRVFVLSEEALAPLVAGLKVTPEWEEDVEHGLWSVWIEELEIYGQGETRDEAKADLLEAAIEYAEVYLDEIPFYFKVGWQSRYPYALAIILADGDKEKLAALLGV